MAIYLTDYQKSKHFSNAVKDSSVYGYQLQTLINCSKMRWQRNPLLIRAKVL